MSREPGLRSCGPATMTQRFLFYEVYAADAAFLAHCNGPLVALCRIETGWLVGKISGTSCILHDVKDEPGVKKGEGGHARQR
jgi:hypothetical protein